MDKQCERQWMKVRIPMRSRSATFQKQFHVSVRASVPRSVAFLQPIHLPFQFRKAREMQKASRTKWRSRLEMRKEKTTIWKASMILFFPIDPPQFQLQLRPPIASTLLRCQERRREHYHL